MRSLLLPALCFSLSLPACAEAEPAASPQAVTGCFLNELLWGDADQAAALLLPPRTWGEMRNGMPAPPYSLFRVPQRSGWETLSGYRRRAAEYYRTQARATHAVAAEFQTPQLQLLANGQGQPADEAAVRADFRWYARQEQQQKQIAYTIHLRQHRGQWLITGLSPTH